MLQRIGLDFKHSREYKNQMCLSAGGDGKEPTSLQRREETEIRGQSGVKGLLLRQCQEIPGKLRCYPTTQQN